MSDRFNRAVDKFFKTAETRSWVVGRLGRLNADGSVTIQVAGRPGEVFVALGSDGSFGLTTAKNPGAVPTIGFLPVRMKREASGLVIRAIDYNNPASNNYAAAHGVIAASYTGRLAAPTTITGHIPLDNTVPLISEGTKIIDATYAPGAAGRRISIRAIVPYLEIATATNAVILSLFAGSNFLYAATRNIVTGAGNGAGIAVEGEFVSVDTASLVIQARLGSDTGGGNLTMVNVFGDLQPVLLVKEYA